MSKPSNRWVGDRWRRFNHTGRHRNRRRVVVFVGIAIVMAGIVWLAFGPPKLVPVVQPVVDVNFEKLQHCRQMNRELVDRNARAIDLLDQGRGMAAVEKVLKGEEE